jgi:hypothetical protein
MTIRRNRDPKSESFWYSAAAKVACFAFPKHIKGSQHLSADTLYKARANGGALGTVAMMVLDCSGREEAEAIREFVSDCVEAAHPLWCRTVEEYTRMESEAEARENMATVEYHQNPNSETALRLYAASAAESIIERGRRSELLRKHA